MRLALDRGVGAVSPDGKTLVVPALGTDGTVHLWLRPMNSAHAQIIPGTEDASFPFWKPDSREIGFFAQGRLKKVRLPGGPVQVLANAPLGRGGSWSRRGQILFAPRTFSGIEAIHEEGGAVRQVTQLKEDDARYLWPYFLPDGSHFLYYAGSRKPGRTGFYAGSLDGSPAQFVLAQGLIGNVEFAPSSNHRSGWLLYVNQGVLQAHAFDPDSLKVSGEPRAIASGIPYPPSTGNVFTSAGEDLLLYQSGQEIKTQPTWFFHNGQMGGAAAEPGDFGEVRLSPDSERLAAQWGYSLRCATNIENAADQGSVGIIIATSPEQDEAFQGK